MNTLLPKKKRTKFFWQMPRKRKGTKRQYSANHAATKQKRQCSERIRGNIAKIDMRKCRAAMPHSSVTLRYYRANTCFCLLFSHPLRMLYTSPKPHFVDAKAPSSPSTCTSIFPRAASPRHPLVGEKRRHTAIGILDIAILQLASSASSFQACASCR